MALIQAFCFYALIQKTVFVDNVGLYLSIKGRVFEGIEIKNVAALDIDVRHFRL